MKEKLRVLAILLAGLLAGCGWMEKNAPWLGVKKKEAKPVEPKHESVLRPQDAMATTQPATQPATQPLAARPPETQPAAQTQPAADVPVTEPLPEEAEAVPVAEGEPVAGPMAAREPATQPAIEPAEPPADVLGESRIVGASIVQVNDKPISIRDVMRFLERELAAVPTQVSEATYRQKVADIIAAEVKRQVFQELILGEAQRRLTDPQKEHLDKQMEDTLREMVAEAGGSRQKLREKFKEEGTTLEAVMADHRRRATVDLYLRSRFMPNINVTGNMLWRYYQSHKADFTRPKMVQMQIIVAPFREFLPKGISRPTELERRAARATARQHIDKAVKRLVEGRPFSEVAREMSRGIKAKAGGLWDPMPQGSFKAERVERVAFKLKEGQMAGPVETPDGVYIVKAVRVTPGKTIPYEDAQEEIEKILREEQYAKATDEYFDELIKSATLVESKGGLKLATDYVVQKHYRR